MKTTGTLFWVLLPWHTTYVCHCQCYAYAIAAQITIPLHSCSCIVRYHTVIEDPGIRTLLMSCILNNVCRHYINDISRDVFQLKIDLPSICPRDCVLLLKILCPGHISVADKNCTIWSHNLAILNHIHFNILTRFYI